MGLPPLFTGYQFLFFIDCKWVLIEKKKERRFYCEQERGEGERGGIRHQGSDGGEKNVIKSIKKTFLPNQQWWYAKWKLSRNMYTLHARFFRTFGADLHAPSVLISKISASELSRKFIKSALLVGFFF